MTKDGWKNYCRINSRSAQMPPLRVPGGRTATAKTDAQMTAKVLSYSRSKGLFAGIALDGAVLRPSGDDNEALYGRQISARTSVEWERRAASRCPSVDAEIGTIFAQRE